MQERVINRGKQMSVANLKGECLGIFGNGLIWDKDYLL
jgi:hypothetical protein